MSFQVVSTATDNGSNFVKAFREFGKQQESNKEDDTDLASIPMQVINVQDEFHEINNCEVVLPNDYRCFAHTLNLLTSSEVESVTGWSFGACACLHILFRNR